MATTSILKNDNGSIEFSFGDGTSSIFWIAPTNIKVKSASRSSGGRKTKIDYIEITSDGESDFIIPFSELLNINGSAKPVLINDAVAMIATEVFSNGGGDGSGSRGSATNESTEPLTAINLDNLYPDAENRFIVVAPNTGGGMVYLKVIKDGGQVDWLSWAASEVAPGETLFSSLQGKGIEGFGDSVWYGQAASDIELTSVRAKLTAYIGGPGVNYAVQGHKIAQQLPFLMKNPNINRDYLSIWEPVVNDIRTSSYNNPQQPVMPRYGARTFIVQKFIDVSIPASDPSITSVGSWAPSALANVNAATKYVGEVSVTLNDYKEYHFTGDNVFFSVLMQDQNAMDGIIIAGYKVYLDSVLQTSFSGYSTGGGDSYYYNFSFYLRNLEPGEHTLRIINNSDNGNPANRQCIITEFGTLKQPQDCVPIIVATCLPFDFSIHAGGLTVDGYNRVNQSIRDEVAPFKADGFPVDTVEWVDYTCSPTQSVDRLHPNDEGFVAQDSDYKRISFMHA